MGVVASIGVHLCQAMQILWAECSVEASQDQEESGIERTVYCMTDDCKHFRIAVSVTLTSNGPAQVDPFCNFKQVTCAEKGTKSNHKAASILQAKDSKDLTNFLVKWRQSGIAGVNLHFAFKLDCTVHLAENLWTNSQHQSNVEDLQLLQPVDFILISVAIYLEQSAFLEVTLLFAASRINEGRLKPISATSWQRLQNIGYSCSFSVFHIRSWGCCSNVLDSKKQIAPATPEENRPAESGPYV